MGRVTRSSKKAAAPAVKEPIEAADTPEQQQDDELREEQQAEEETKCATKAGKAKDGPKMSAKKAKKRGKKGKNAKKGEEVEAVAQEAVNAEKKADQGVQKTTEEEGVEVMRKDSEDATDIPAVASEAPVAVTETPVDVLRELDVNVESEPAEDEQAGGAEDAAHAHETEEKIEEPAVSFAVTEPESESQVESEFEEEASSATSDEDGTRDRINDDIGAELQLMSDAMHGKVDETAVDAELEQMAEEARPQTPQRPQAVVAAAKTPRFDPSIHLQGDDYADVGNDSFELRVSPKKSVVPVKPVSKAPAAAAPKAAKPATASKAKDEKPKTEKAGKAPSKTSTVAKKHNPALSIRDAPKPAKRVASVSSLKTSDAAPGVNPRAASSASQNSQGSAAVIPHSKPRAIGLSFPAPPPPAKSTKPPTKSTFELPGEAFQRKIKAQKEERQKRMEEEEKKRREFKARPVPKTTYKPVVPAKIGGAARESLANISSSQRSTPEVAGDAKTEAKPAAAGPPKYTVPPAKKPVAAATIRPPPKEEVPLDRAAQAQAVLKARKEAAERGRQTVKMWAESQKQKEDRAKAAAAAAAPTATA